MLLGQDEEADMRVHRVLGSLIVAAASAVACGSSGGGGGQPPPPISATSYDQSCQSAADCIVVTDGNVCQPCIGGPFDSCSGTAAINKKDQARYQTDFDDLQAQCPSRPPQACPEICAVTFATCTAGTCGVCHASGCADAGAPDAGGDSSGDSGSDAGGDATRD